MLPREWVSVLSALLLWGILAQGISCRYVLTVQKKKCAELHQKSN